MITGGHGMETTMVCTNCGIPLDAQYFDESGMQDRPSFGDTIVLASFQLQPQYCGVLEYFAQYVGQRNRGLSVAETPGLEWTIQVNGSPLYPYTGVEIIVNPWGVGGFPVNIRLSENALVEFVVRATQSVQTITRVGGRIMGRFWYNSGYGGVLRNG